MTQGGFRIAYVSDPLREGRVFVGQIVVEPGSKNFPKRICVNVATESNYIELMPDIAEARLIIASLQWAIEATKEKA
jgi:hypothetical protein